MKVILNNNLFLVKWKHEHPQPDGSGCTVCKIQLGEKILTEAEAICSSKDQFCKDIGRKISLARALPNLALHKKERKIFWDEYFKRA